MLVEARSEVIKQEHKVESLDTCINGYVESRREQVRLQEELVIKEEALRDTQIRSIHERGELKRAQELRVDEFAVQKLRESHETMQRLTSQTQELQGEVHERIPRISRYRIEFVENVSPHVPSQRAVFPRPRSVLSRDKRLPPDTWNLSEPQGNVFFFFWQSTPYGRFKSTATAAWRLDGNTSYR